MIQIPPTGTPGQTRVYTCLCDVCGASGPALQTASDDQAWSRDRLKSMATQRGWAERLEGYLTLLLCRSCVEKRPYVVESDAGARRSWHATIEQAADAARSAKGPVRVYNLLRHDGESDGLTDEEREIVGEAGV